MDVIAVAGLGYAGLPLAVAFGRHQRTVGFDHNARKVEEYQRIKAASGLALGLDLASAPKLELTSDPAALADADIIIVVVPTPVDEAHRPDLDALGNASDIVGRHMKKGVTVIYESTVYPGVTEDVCVPILEQSSGLKWKSDFHVGYSPERINPGDTVRGLADIVKVVAGDDAPTLERVAALYGKVITAGVHKVSSIQVAEAAKVIENTQRDLNIALMNELAVLFDRLGLDTIEVLEAAGTKWNFLPFRPGLVGGHCIGVDPYYLTYKAEMIGYHPQVILAGRRINDGMGKFVAEQTIKHLIRQGCKVLGAKLALFGLAFKEDVADLRNSRVIDIVRELKTYGAEVLVHDPVVRAEEAHEEYGLTLTEWDKLPKVDAIILAVAHQPFLRLSVDDIKARLNPNGVLIDVKSVFKPGTFKDTGIIHWRM